MQALILLVCGVVIFMSDSIKDLGTVELWRPGVNWRDTPDYGFDFAREVLEFEGTAHEVLSLSARKPHKLSFTVTNKDKAEEFALLEKFYELQGRYARFWFPNPVNLFTLKESALINATELIVNYNGWTFEEFTRIGIELKSGDLLTRLITAAVDNIGAGKTTLTLFTALDRALAPTDIERFSTVFLSRLGNDTLDLQYQCKTVSETKLEIVEIPWEVSQEGILGPSVVIESIEIEGTTVTLTTTTGSDDIPATVPPGVPPDIVIRKFPGEVGGEPESVFEGTRTGAHTITFEISGTEDGWWEIALNGVIINETRYEMNVIFLIDPAIVTTANGVFTLPKVGYATWQMDNPNESLRYVRVQVSGDAQWHITIAGQLGGPGYGVWAGPNQGAPPGDENPLGTYPFDYGDQMYGYPIWPHSYGTPLTVSAG